MGRTYRKICQDFPEPLELAQGALALSSPLKFSPGVGTQKQNSHRNTKGQHASPHYPLHCCIFKEVAANSLFGFNKRFVYLRVLYPCPCLIKCIFGVCHFLS